MQIQSFFSWLAKCKNSEAQIVSDKDYEAAENEEVLATLRNEVHVLENIQSKHPVMYDGYNLCELVTSQKLSKLKISKLSEICRSFKLEVPAHFQFCFLFSLTKIGLTSCSAEKAKLLLIINFFFILGCYNSPKNFIHGIKLAITELHSV